MSDDLVARLKAKASDTTYKSKPFNLMMDAAERIIAQRELIQEMREALKPFADNASDWDQDWVDKARSTLSKAKSQQEGETE